MPCNKEKMWKRVCEAWYSVALNVLEEPYNAIPSRTGDLIKAKREATIHRLYDLAYNVIVFHWNVFKVCCCLFYWNLFDIYIHMLSD